MPLTKKDGKELIKLARQSINSEFSRAELNVSKDIKDKYSSKHGVFVTLNLNDELKGCIGYPEPTLPLFLAVIEAAKSAAFSDSRFSPLSKEGFSKIKIELSVLTVPSLIKVNEAKEYFEKIKIGEDGLILRGNYGSGLLLPQVFVEYDCDVIKALDMLCQKAGLPPHAWNDTSNKIYKFQAQIFSE
jgi:AmmeMemoRadiSam system protein A|tara:strand:+ start:328 stop:888 length:561 start_codon:yes stop_codon:yes gene_type:complete